MIQGVLTSVTLLANPRPHVLREHLHWSHDSRTAGTAWPAVAWEALVLLATAALDVADTTNMPPPGR